MRVRLPALAVRMLLVIHGLDRNDLHPGQDRQDAILRNLAAVVLDMDHACRAGVGFQHARKRPEPFRDGARTALVADPIHLPQRMAIALADRRARAFDHLADAGERHDVRVVVDTQLRRLALRARADVHLPDAVATVQIVDQPPDAGIGLVRYLRQQDLQVDA